MPPLRIILVVESHTFIEKTAMYGNLALELETIIWLITYGDFGEHKIWVILMC